MSTETTDPAQTDDGGTSTDPTFQEPTTGGSLEDLLADLDETQRNAILGEVSKARTEAKNLRSRLRKSRETPNPAQQQNDAETVSKLREAEANLAKWRTATVQASVRALAAQTFADPDDARLFLTDLEDYVGEDGIVDEAAIRGDLETVLKAKPHLAKHEGRRGPKPDPTQASGANGGTPNADPATAFQNWLTQRM